MFSYGVVRLVLQRRESWKGAFGHLVTETDRGITGVSQIVDVGWIWVQSCNKTLDIIGLYLKSINKLHFKPSQFLYFFNIRNT